MGACQICGTPIPRGNGTVPLKFCGDRCKAASNFVAAAERAVGAIVFPETAEGREAQRRLRARIRGLANKMGNKWMRPRDKRGRFLGNFWRASA